MSKLKLVMLGDQGTGKSSLVLRCVYNTFENNYQGTIGIDFLSHVISVNQKPVRLQIWDTAGQERFRALIPSYVRDSRICLVVYDVCNQKSYDRVQWWLDLIKREKNKDDTTIMIIGNQIDKEDSRVIATSEACQLARDNHCLYRETSAKTGHNVKDVFVYAAQNYIENSATSFSYDQTEMVNVVLTEESTNSKNNRGSQCAC